MRFSSIIAAMLFFCSSALAQRTVVSGTVKDSNGTPYAGGTLVATLSLPLGASGATLNGVQIAGSTQRVTLDNTGSFLMQLPDNAVVLPGGTQWTFNVNISPGVAPPLGTGPQSCSATLTITGASQSISSSLAACPTLSNVSSGLGSSTFAALPALCTPGVTAPLNVTTVPVGIYYCDATNHWTNAGLSGAATLRMTDFGVVADAKMNTGCTWASGLNPPTVTCAAANSIPFTASDTGKVCAGPFSPSRSVGVATFLTSTTETCNAGINSVGTASAYVVYTDNATNALAAWNTLIAFPRCGTLIVPNGVWANSEPLVGATPCALGPAPSESGGLTVRSLGGSMTSTMFQPPNFDFANCQATDKACMFDISGNSQLQLEDFAITGANLSMSGLTCGTGLNGEFTGATNVRIKNVQLLYGFNNCSNAFYDLFLAGGAQGAVIYGFSQFDAFGTGPALQITAPNVLIEDLFIGDGPSTALQINSGASIVSHNNFFDGSTGPGVATSGSAQFYSFGDQIGSGSGITMDLSGSTAQLDLQNGTLSGAASTFEIYTRGSAGSSPTVGLRDMVITNGSTAGISGDAGAGVIFDYGNNRIANTTNPFTGKWLVTGPPVFVGKGTGVCTSSVTVFLFPIGQNTARTCTVVAESLLTGAGIINQAGAGTATSPGLHNLRCTATAAGSTAGSGVMTVRLNGVNTAITATFGTTTTANDSTHLVAVVPGDEVTIQGVMGVAETLANPSCQVQVN